MDEPSTSRNNGEWTSEELKLLFYCINLRGAHETSMEYIFSHIDSRSEEEIKEKIDEIRRLVREGNERKRKQELQYWLENDVEISNESEVQTWSAAAEYVQGLNRKITDHTCKALMDHLWSESESLSQTDPTQQLLCTDSQCLPSHGRRDEVDFARFYRFLYSAVNNRKFETNLRSLEAGILLSIYEDIQNEVDDFRLEEKRKMLVGIFRDIQDGDMSDYDFRYSRVCGDATTVQLNPFSLTKEHLDPSSLYSNAAEEGPMLSH